MATFDYGIKAIHPGTAQAHILGFGAAQSATGAIDSLQVWGGPTSASQVFAVHPSGEVRMGTSSSASLATTATRGFLGITSCAGVPTGIPADLSATHAGLIYDRTNHKLYINLAGTWRSVAVT